MEACDNACVKEVNKMKKQTEAIEKRLEEITKAYKDDQKEKA